MQFDLQTQAAARMADYDRIAVAADLVRQARTSLDDQEEPRTGWITSLMMSLGLRTPTIEHAGV